MEEIKHTVKNPAGIGTMIGMAFQILIACSLLVRLWDKLGVWQYALILAVLLCIGVLLITAYRASRKADDLYLYHDQLLLHGQAIRAEDIQAILIRGYVKPVIGILPHGKKIVPLNRCFRFPSDADSGIKDLKRWAEQNQVKLVYKSFQTWV